MKLKKIFSGHKGFVLPAVVVITALVAGITGFIISLISSSTQEAQNVKDRITIHEVHNNISSILAERAFCRATFIQKVTQLTDGVEIDGIYKDTFGATDMMKGSYFEGVKLVSMTIRNPAIYSSTHKEFNLQVRYAPKKGQDIVLTIPMLAKVVAGDIVDSCFAKDSMLGLSSLFCKNIGGSELMSNDLCKVSTVITSSLKQVSSDLRSSATDRNAQLATLKGEVCVLMQERTSRGVGSVPTYCL